MSYNAPKLHEYETYRYKAKDYKANLQPLPRSSYKSEYLVYNPRKIPPIKNSDNQAGFGRSREIAASTYNKDYQSVKADLINYK